MARGKIYVSLLLCEAEKLRHKWIIKSVGRNPAVPGAHLSIRRASGGRDPSSQQPLNASGKWGMTSVSFTFMKMCTRLELKRADRRQRKFGKFWCCIHASCAADCLMHGKFLLRTCIWRPACYSSVHRPSSMNTFRK